MSHAKLIGSVSALLLAMLIAWRMYTEVRETMIVKDGKLLELIERVRPLFDGRIHYRPPLHAINTRDVLEEVEMYQGEKSYTINKEKIFMCMKDEHDEYYKDNMLIYVLLHEISHVLSESVGHTDEFYAIFHAILEQANKMNIYDASRPINQEYCLYTDEDDDKIED